MDFWDRSCLEWSLANEACFGGGLSLRSGRRPGRELGGVDLAGQVNSVSGMSLAELKKEAVSLSAEEKRELADFLQGQIEPQLAERRARASALMREMDAGRKFSRGDFERTDRELSAAGL